MPKPRNYQLGQRFDVWWEIVKISEWDDNHHKKYLLRNVANNMQVEVSDNTLDKIRDGKTSVSSVIYTKRNGQGYKYFKTQKFKDLKID